jgi:polygalacturonase
MLLLSINQLATAQSVTITDFGAVGDGQTLNTNMIQSAIDFQSSKGGGKVIVPVGEFLTGTIELKSNIHLYLENGSILKGSPNLDHYRRYRNGTQLGVLYTENAERVAITGYGTIDGNGRAFVYHDRKKDLSTEMKQFTRQGVAYLDTLKGVQDGPVVPFEHVRPYQMVLFSNVSQLNIHGITLVDSPFWAFHAADSDGIMISDIRVRNSLLMPNADGLNFTSSSNITITGCDIIAGDDALAFSGYSVHHELPGYNDIRHVSQNVTVSNCLLQTRSSGIRVGGIDQNSLRNYRFDNITIFNSNRGIGLFVHQDGSIENVHFSNMTIQTRLHTGDWWGNGEPIHISVIEGAPVEQRLGNITNVSFTNIEATGENGIIVYGDVAGLIDDIRFNNVRLYMKNGPLQDEYGGNFDLRPATELGKNLFKHDIPGIFIRHANRIELNGVHVNWSDAMHSNFKHGLWTEEVHDLKLKNTIITAPNRNQDALNLVRTTILKSELDN